MGSKPSVPKIDTSGIRKNTAKELQSNLGPFGQTGAVWDPKTKTVKSQLQLDPMLERGVTSGLGRIEDFDPRAQQRQAQAYEANYKPFQMEIQNQMENLFGQMGRGGRNSSRGIDFMARTADDLAANQGQRMYQLMEDTKSRQLAEDQQRLQPFMTPAMQMAQATQQQGSALQNARQQLGQSLLGASQQQAQMAAQAQAGDKGGIGGALGTVAGIAAPVLSGYMPGAGGGR